MACWFRKKDIRKTDKHSLMLPNGDGKLISSRLTYRL